MSYLIGQEKQWFVHTNLAKVIEDFWKKQVCLKLWNTLLAKNSNDFNFEFKKLSKYKTVRDFETSEIFKVQYKTLK